MYERERENEREYFFSQSAIKIKILADLYGTAGKTGEKKGKKIRKSEALKMDGETTRLYIRLRVDVSSLALC